MIELGRYYSSILKIKLFIKSMAACQQESKRMSITPSIIQPKRNMPLKFTKPPSWFLRIEIDMLAASSDSEEGIVHQIPEKWWRNGPKNNSEI
jgi:hypothetical protein